jgi:hypothetical protein
MGVITDSNGSNRTYPFDKKKQPQKLTDQSSYALFKVERIQRKELKPDDVFELRNKEINLKEDFYREILTVIPIDVEDDETSNLIVKVNFYQNSLPKSIQQSGNIAVPDVPNRDNDGEKPLKLEVGPDQGNGSST